MPWRQGTVLVWAATCPDTFAPLYRARVTQAKQNKKAKYAHLDSSHHFVPVAVESLETTGVPGPEACLFLQELGHRLRVAAREQLSPAAVSPPASVCSGAAVHISIYILQLVHVGE